MREREREREREQERRGIRLKRKLTLQRGDQEVEGRRIDQTLDAEVMAPPMTALTSASHVR